MLSNKGNAPPRSVGDAAPEDVSPPKEITVPEEPMDMENSELNTKVSIPGNTILPSKNFPVNQVLKDAADAVPQSQLPQEVVNETVGIDGISDEAYSSSTGIIDFRFENILPSKVGTAKDEIKYLSESTYIRCLPWKILLIFPRRDARSSMGMFLQCNAESSSVTWTCYAKAQLELLSQVDQSLNKVLSISHVFSHKENDWGFQQFIPYQELCKPENGFIHNDSITVRIQVEADPPHGANWDSKRYTGFVGLKNQGATCYLNSLLQVLYCTNKLRRAVFLMPTESDDDQTSVPLALQRTFYELQFSDTAVGTKKLTRSFGWATLDSFMQHDAQELCRVLLDNIENKMKGTSVEDIIPSLFCGKMLSYIRCKNVPYESKREEKFYDVQLKVKGNKTINDAFKEYIQEETLCNNNRYDAGVYGFQDAFKGVKFLNFPPVLYLQLMRFQYDYNTDTNVKINDRFEFPYDLQLDAFLLQSIPDQPVSYFLHAVLAHSGDNHGGHYITYINPRGNNEWYQFDDDVVSKCRPRDAINANFGGTEDPDARQYSNAYMLVYIANSARDVLRPVTEDDIPLSLRKRFCEEHELEAMKRREKQAAHRYTTINLLLDEDFYGAQGPDLFKVENLPLRAVRVDRKVDIVNYIDTIAKAVQQDPSNLRVWQMSPRVKKAVTDFNRPTLTDGLDLRCELPYVFWVQFLSSSLLPSNIKTDPTSAFEPPRNSRLMFFKFFDPVNLSLTYCGHADVGPQTSTSELSKVLASRAGLPNETEIILFKDVTHRTPTALTVTDLVELPLLYDVHGEILIFQAATSTAKSSATGLMEMGKNAFSTLTCSMLSDDTSSKAVAAINNGPKETSSAASLPVTEQAPAAGLTLRKLALKLNEAPSQSQLDPCIEYCRSYIQQVEVLLVDKLRSSDPGILLKVAETLRYEEFAKVAAAHLTTTPDKLQFFQSQPLPITGPNAPGTLAAHDGPVANPAIAANMTQLGVNLMGSAVSPASLSTGATSANDQNKSISIDSLPTDTPQVLAAKASGFGTISLSSANTLVALAIQGLLYEPPGPAIPSTSKGLLRDILQLGVPPPPSLMSATAGTDQPPSVFLQYSGTPRKLSTPFRQVTVQPIRRIYYVHLSVPIEQLEALRQLRVIYIGPKLSETAELLLSVQRTGTVADVLLEARRHIALQPGGSGQLRLMEVSANRIIQEFQPTIPIENLRSVTNFPGATDALDRAKPILRVEEIPLDEINLRDGESVIYAAHFYKVLTDTFGVPFTVRVKDGERYIEVKERIRRRLEISEKEFDTWNFFIVRPKRAVSFPKEEHVLVDRKHFLDETSPTTQPWFGIEHKPCKRPRYAPSEKPIKIHN